MKRLRIKDKTLYQSIDAETKKFDDIVTFTRKLKFLYPLSALKD